MKTQRTLSRRDLLCAGAAAAAGLALPWNAMPAAPTGYQIGCYTRPWAQYEYRVALDNIAEAGYKYAGLMTAKSASGLVVSGTSAPEEAAAVAEEVRKRGLKALSLFAGVFSLEKSIEAGIAELKKMIDNCALCQSSSLLLGGTTDEKMVRPYYKVVAECCDYAAAKGVGLCIKPHGGQNATGPQCRKLIEGVGSKNFGLWYDPANIFYYSDGKIDPVADSLSVNGLVVGMSAKDFKAPKEVMLTPGTGLVKFPEVFSHLKSGGFTHGPMIVECLDRGEIPQITAEAKKARRFLEHLTGQKA